MLSITPSVQSPTAWSKANLETVGTGKASDKVAHKSLGANALQKTVYLNLLYKKSLSNWCDGAGADETARITNAIADCASLGVQVLEGATDANYVFTGQLTLPDRLSIAGNGCKFSPANDGFKTMGGAVDGGKVFYKDFSIVGVSSAANRAFALGYNNVLARIQGVSLDSIFIDNFLYGIDARTIWHAVFNNLRIMRCKTGVALIGQCPHVSITNSQIISTISAYGDGSVGVFTDQFTYSDAVARRPEQLVIDGTLIYGYDTNVYLSRLLRGTVINSDIDGFLKYGVRATTVDGGVNIHSNYMGGIHNANPILTAVQIDDLGSANSSAVRVADNDIFFSGAVGAGSIGIYIGTNRTGKKIISGNDVGLGTGVETALKTTTVSNADVYDNKFAGTVFSINTANGGKNRYTNCTFNGPISRTGTRTKDWFVDCDGTAVTGFDDLITYPATVTTATLAYTTDLGLSAAPVIGAPANLLPYCEVTQVTGATSMGFLRARDSGAGGVIVDRTVALGSPSADIKLKIVCR